MGVAENFQSLFRGSGAAVGGGVTPGRESWIAQPDLRSTVVRTPKPMILYASLGDADAAHFLEVMGAIFCRGMDAMYVRPDGVVTDPMSGVRWVPDQAGAYQFGAISLALEDAGFNPTRCAVLPYTSVVGGISGMVHFPSQVQMVVRLQYGAETDPRFYEGIHDLKLVQANPFTFATEVKTFTKGG